MSGTHLIATIAIVAAFGAFMVTLAYVDRTTNRK